MKKENILPLMIEELRKEKQLTLEDLGLKLGKSKSAISRWTKGDRSPMVEDLEKLADVLDTDILTLLYGKRTVSVPQTIASAVKLMQKLSSSQQLDVLHYITEMSKTPPSSRCIPIDVTEALAAGVGYAYGDNETIQLYTDRQDLKDYDIASRVSGDSMEPKYSNGDVVLIKKNTHYTNGLIYAIDFNEKSYLKKVYFEKKHLRLVSLNDKYDDILIPKKSEHYLNIVGEVVDSFTPVD